MKHSHKARLTLVTTLLALAAAALAWAPPARAATWTHEAAFTLPRNTNGIPVGPGGHLLQTLNISCSDNSHDFYWNGSGSIPTTFPVCLNCGIWTFFDTNWTDRVEGLRVYSYSNSVVRAAGIRGDFAAWVGGGWWANAPYSRTNDTNLHGLYNYYWPTHPTAWAPPADTNVWTYSLALDTGTVGTNGWPTLGTNYLSSMNIECSNNDHDYGWNTEDTWTTNRHTICTNCLIECDFGASYTEEDYEDISLAKRIWNVETKLNGTNWGTTIGIGLGSWYEYFGVNVIDETRMGGVVRTYPSDYTDTNVISTVIWFDPDGMTNCNGASHHALTEVIIQCTNGTHNYYWNGAAALSMTNAVCYGDKVMVSYGGGACTDGSGRLAFNVDTVCNGVIVQSSSIGIGAGKTSTGATVGLAVAPINFGAGPQAGFIPEIDLPPEVLKPLKLYNEIWNRACNNVSDAASGWWNKLKQARIYPPQNSTNYTYQLQISTGSMFLGAPQFPDGPEGPPVNECRHLITEVRIMPPAGITNGYYYWSINCERSLVQTHTIALGTCVYLKCEGGHEDATDPNWQHSLQWDVVCTITEWEAGLRSWYWDWDPLHGDHSHLVRPVFGRMKTGNPSEFLFQFEGRAPSLFGLDAPALLPLVPMENPILW